MKDYGNNPRRLGCLTLVLLVVGLAWQRLKDWWHDVTQKHANKGLCRREDEAR